MVESVAVNLQDLCTQTRSRSEGARQGPRVLLSFALVSAYARNEARASISSWSCGRAEAASQDRNGRISRALGKTSAVFSNHVWTGKQQTRRVAYVCQALMERSDEKIRKVRSLTANMWDRRKGGSCQKHPWFSNLLGSIENPKT